MFSHHASFEGINRTCGGGRRLLGDRTFKRRAVVQSMGQRRKQNTENCPRYIKNLLGELSTHQITTHRSHSPDNEGFCLVLANQSMFEKVK